MAELPRHDVQLSGEVKQTPKKGLKAKLASRFCTLTSDQTSVTRVPKPSSVVSSALDSMHFESFGGDALPNNCADGGLGRDPEEADCILEDSDISEHSEVPAYDWSMNEYNIPDHRRTIHDCDAPPSICKLDHMAMLLEFVADEGWEPFLSADTGDDIDIDKSLMQDIDLLSYADDMSDLVVRLNPATDDLQAGEEYGEVMLEEWAKSRSAGDSRGSEAKASRPAEPAQAAEQEPSRKVWFNRLSWTPVTGGDCVGKPRPGGVSRPAPVPRSLIEAEPLAGSPAVSLRRLRSWESASQDSTGEAPSSLEARGR